LLARGHLCIFQ